VAAIDGIERIRYTTSHPVEFSDSLIDAYADIPKLVDHLHLPVQSGSDRILAADEARPHGEEYKSKIRRLRKIRPHISCPPISSSAFPARRTADFEATMDLIEDHRLRQLFQLHLQRRAPARRPPTCRRRAPMAETKKQRLQILQARINCSMAAEISRRMVGSTQRILVTGVSKKRSGTAAAGAPRTIARSIFPRAITR
jgi:tRNA-2-methylthio-N6-dimethylallyladenosine synthase